MWNRTRYDIKGLRIQKGSLIILNWSWLKKFGKNIKVPIIFIQQKMTRTFFQIIWILMNNVLLKNSIYFNLNTLLIRQCFHLDYGFADEDVMEDQIYVLPEEWISYLPFQRRVLTTRRQTTWKGRGLTQNDYCNNNGKDIAVEVCGRWGRMKILICKKEKY